MRYLDLPAWRTDTFKGLVGKPATLPHGLPVVAPPLTVRIAGQVVAVYVRASAECVALAREVMHAQRATANKRTAGVAQQSVVYGSLPRLATRNNYCRMSQQTITGGPEVWAKAQRVARAIAGYYREHLPDAYAAHQALADEILPHWRIPETPFTTINWNTGQRIPYHQDSANQRGTCNNVLVLREGVAGGELVVPEFGVALRQHDGDLTIFHGQRIVHGVAAFRDAQPGGYRCSVVAYGLQQLAACGAPEAELQRARQGRQAIEDVWRTDKAAALLADDPSYQGPEDA